MGTKDKSTCESATDPRFQQMDYGILSGDDLRLPNQRDHQEAHRKDADRERQAHLSF